GWLNGSGGCWRHVSVFTSRKRERRIFQVVTVAYASGSSSAVGLGEIIGGRQGDHVLVGRARIGIVDGRRVVSRAKRDGDTDRRGGAGAYGPVRRRAAFPTRLPGAAVVILEQ